MIHYTTISVFLQGNLSLFSIPPLFAKSLKSTVCVFSPPLLTSKGSSFEPLEPPLLLRAWQCWHSVLISESLWTVVESNTEHSWQGYVGKNVMSRNVDWCCRNSNCCQLSKFINWHCWVKSNFFYSYCCWTIVCYKFPKHLHWTPRWISLCFQLRYVTNGTIQC